MDCSFATKTTGLRPLNEKKTILAETEFRQMRTDLSSLPAANIRIFIHGVTWSRKANKKIHYFFTSFFQ